MNGATVVSVNGSGRNSSSDKCGLIGLANIGNTVITAVIIPYTKISRIQYPLEMKPRAISVAFYDKQF